MKKLYLLTVVAMVMIMTGCRKDNSADVRELFKSVPGTSSFVAVVNIESLIEKSGSDISDGAVKPSAELEAAINSAKGGDNENIKAILNGDSGIEPSVSVFFADGYALYNTGLLASTSKFEKWVQNESGEEWKEDNGIRYNGVVALKDNRYWWVLKGRSSIDPAVVRNYLALSGNQSFDGGRFADRLADSDKDVIGWCDINGALNVTSLGFEEKTILKMVSGTLFTDAAYSMFDMDFVKGEVKVQASVLDSNGKDARFNFDAGKIDTRMVSSLGGQADVLAAVAIPSKLVEQLREQTKGQMSMLGVMLNSLSCVDGTLAVAFSQSQNGVKGCVQTNGGNTGDLMSLLSEMDLTPRLEGKTVEFSKGTLSGGMGVSDMGDMLKGATMGFVVAGTAVNKSDNFEKVVFKLVPEGKSVKLIVEGFARDGKSNSLVTILKSIGE